MAFDYDFESEGEARRRGSGGRGPGRAGGYPGRRRAGAHAAAGGRRWGAGGGGGRGGGAWRRSAKTQGWGAARSAGGRPGAQGSGRPGVRPVGGRGRWAGLGRNDGWPASDDGAGTGSGRPWVFRWRWPGPPPWWVAPPGSPPTPDDAQDAAVAPPDAAPVAVVTAAPGGPAPDGSPPEAVAPAAAAGEPGPDDAAPAQDAGPAAPGELVPWLSRAVAAEVGRTVAPRAAVAWSPAVTVHGHPFTAPAGGGVYVVVKEGTPIYVGEAESFAGRWSGRMLSAHQLGLTAPDGRLPSPLTVYFGRLEPRQAADPAVRKAVEHAVIRTLVRGRVVPVRTRAGGQLVPDPRALRNRTSSLQLRVERGLGVEHVLPADLMAQVKGPVPGLSGDTLDLAHGARYEVGPA